YYFIPHRKMKAFRVLLFISLLIEISACHDEDEILTPQPAVDNTTVKADTSATRVVPSKDTAAIDSAIYQRKKFQNMPYRILFPKNYDPNKKYPMLIFLH